jgi:hypothetical protein
MGYDAELTPILVAALRKEPGREFTASELEARTSIPERFVRRALTVDAERTAEVPMDGVTMAKRDGLWRFSWGGGAEVPSSKE